MFLTTAASVAAKKESNQKLKLLMIHRFFHGWLGTHTLSRATQFLHLTNQAHMQSLILTYWHTCSSIFLQQPVQICIFCGGAETRVQAAAGGAH